MKSVRIVVKALLVYTTDNTSYFLELQRSHKKIVAPGMGDLPGGKVEDNESLEAALVREIKEETSIDILKFYKLAEHQWMHGDQSYQEYLYYIPVSTQQVTISCEEHDNYRWLPLDKLNESTLNPNTIKIITQAKEVIGQLST